MSNIIQSVITSVSAHGFGIAKCDKVILNWIDVTAQLAI